MQQSAQLFKALCEPVRIRMLNLLNHNEEICVCDLMTTLEISQSLASRHLAYLRNSGLVSARREGVWMHYRLNKSDWQVQWICEYLDRLAKQDKQLQADLDVLQAANCC
ncbi:MAG: metalloregulator ArsR/SmtB family transcription factor [Amphritea sp.]